MAQNYDAEARERLIMWIRRRMDEFGITMDELAAAMTTPVYRDAKGNEWSGRGEAPDWIMAAERAGVNRDFFLQMRADEKDDEPVNSGFFLPRH